MLSSRWAFFSLPCSWLYEPVFHLDIFLINVSLSYDKHLLTKKWEDKWNHFWFLTYIIHIYKKKNSRKYNQYLLSVLCKITYLLNISFNSSKLSPFSWISSSNSESLCWWICDSSSFFARIFHRVTSFKN